MFSLARRQAFLIAVDVLIATLSIPFGLFLQYEGLIPSHYFYHWPSVLLFVLLLRFGANLIFGLYRQMWCYAGRKELLLIVGAATFGSALLLAARYLRLLPLIPWFTLLLDWYLNMAGLGVVRLIFGHYFQKKAFL